MIKDFYGYKYDDDKLNNYEEKVEEKDANNWGAIPFIEEAMEENGHYVTLSTCACCGTIIKHSHFGYGSSCFKMVLKSMNVITKISPEFEQLLSEYNLKKWRYFCEVVKKVYVDLNTKENGEIKKFKKEFKKSFMESVLNNKENRFSRKQLDIMLKDIDNNTYYNGCDKYSPEFISEILSERKMLVIDKMFPQKHDELVKDFYNLLNISDVTTFVRITYCKAWIDNPFYKENVA